MKGLVSLVGLIVLASAVPAQSPRFAATYVGKQALIGRQKVGTPTRVTFEKDGTYRWETWKVTGKGMYTRKGNRIAIHVTAIRNKRSSKLYDLKDKGKREGAAQLSPDGRVLTILSEGRPAERLTLVDKGR
ncbi:MAG: hypothetical protein ACO1SV_25455 [Fimbriimonas sp.]